MHLVGGRGVPEKQAANMRIARTAVTSPMTERSISLSNRLILRLRPKTRTKIFKKDQTRIDEHTSC